MNLPLAVTMGEPAGIGGEIVLKAWAARDGATPCFVVIDDPERLRALAAMLGWTMPVVEIASPAEAAQVFPNALPVLRQALARPAIPGQGDPENGAAVLDSIRRAVALTQAGECAAVVTNPINKYVLHQAGFRHPGHTEFLAELAGIATPPVMMLACSELRVVPVSIHIPLIAAATRLTAEAIIAHGRITALALTRDFGIEAPRLAVAGLNPHAGEQGDIGTEDIEIVAPAVAALRALGIDAFGPAPADTLFHARARRGYDAALCMYHDQALIPIKTIDFDGGVNVTLGLPFVRTSPDHGTAFDIAGTGTAKADSLIAALTMAAGMAAQRSLFDRG